MNYQWLTLGAFAARGLRWLPLRRPALLVMRPGSLGDALLFSGVLRVLRQQYPAHRIVLVASRRTLPIFQRSPYCDALATYDESTAADTSLSRRLERIRFAISVLRYRYALLLDARISPAKLPLDWAAALVSEVSSRQRLNLPPPGPHELDRLVVMLRRAGCESVHDRGDILPEAGLNEADRAWATRRLEPLRTLNRHRPILALCPGARFKQKAWGIDNYVDLLREMAGDIDLRRMAVVFLGGVEDQETVEAIMAATANDMSTMLNLAGQSTIHQAMAVIEQCDLCVGNDTFGLHAAITVGTPSVVIMWGGDGDRWVPWGDAEKHRMVRADVDCGGCDGECGQVDHECMSAITPEMLMAAVKSVRGGR